MTCAIFLKCYKSGSKTSSKMCRMREVQKAPALTSRHISPKSRWQVYSSCVRSSMLHGSETWGPNASELQRLRRNDRSMVRWICCVSAHDDHYADVIMTKIASQITSLNIVYSTVLSGADQSKHQSYTSLAFVWGIHRDRWIPRTKGQLRGKCFHLMASSWHPLRPTTGEARPGWHHYRSPLWQITMGRACGACPSNTGIGMVGNLVVMARGVEVGHERPGPNVSRPTSVTVHCQRWIHRIE